MPLVRKALVLCAAFMSLAAAACSGNGGSLSTAEYAESANGICREAKETVDAELEPLGEQVGTAELAEFVERVLPVARKTEDKLRALESPDAFRRDVSRWLAVRSTQIRLWRCSATR
jgi:hypothetical protein